jgi:hypothetical protein
MPSFEFWRFWTSEPAGAKKWSYYLIVFGVSLGLLAIAAGVATRQRSQREVLPAPTTGIANAHSGGGNLVPVF